MANQTINKVTVSFDNNGTITTKTYDIEDTYSRGLIADIPAILTDIEELQDGKVNRSGDTMTGELNMHANLNMSGNINISSGHLLNLNRSASTGGLKAGDDSIVLRCGDDDDNYNALRVRSNTLIPEFTTVEGGSTTRNYGLDICRYTTFSGTSLTAENKHEYTYSTAIASLTITWPSTARGVIFGVNFKSSSAFSGITHRNASGTAFTPKYIGDDTTQANMVYDLVCWYDGLYAWCSVKTASY